ncbi:hypothetical protein C8R47DRAFT_1327129 [Mycena vitilis]|nr:hypothetical protein C8R47DRAFT_1327129 [Mycena vitilis]
MQFCRRRSTSSPTPMGHTERAGSAGAGSGATSPALFLWDSSVLPLIPLGACSATLDTPPRPPFSASPAALPRYLHRHTHRQTRCSPSSKRAERIREELNASGGGNVSTSNAAQNTQRTVAHDPELGTPKARRVLSLPTPVLRTTEAAIAPWACGGEAQDESSESFIGSQYSTNFKARNTDVTQQRGGQPRAIAPHVHRHRVPWSVYVRWWDWDTSVEEAMNGLHNLVASGKVLYLGVSDTPAWVVAQANQYARDHGKSPFVRYQGLWDVLNRSFEREIPPMARARGLALAPWNECHCRRQIPHGRQRGGAACNWRERAYSVHSRQYVLNKVLEDDG